MQDEVVHAAPRAKWWALSLVALIAIAGAPLLFFTRRYLTYLSVLAETDRAAALSGFRTWIAPQLLAAAALTIIAGLWMARLGYRAVRHQRYPLANTWVIHDTPVRRGRDATTIGYVLIATGAIIATMPLLAAAFLIAFLRTN